jgi:hypothetical protein
MTIGKIISNSINHRGCGVRAASYSIGPKAWLPEACVWLQTEKGSHRLWVHSFAHCFDAEKLTFSNKIEADSWALGAARTIIDRALEQLSSAVTPVKQSRKASGPLERLARRSLRTLRRFKTRSSD